MPTDRPAVDISGRPLRLPRRRPRHVPQPEDDRGHRRLRAVGQTEHRDDPQVLRVGEAARRDLLSRAPDLRDGARAQVLRVVGGGARRPRPRDHPHRPRGRHVRRGAAAQGEVRGDLRRGLLGDGRRGRAARTASRRARARRRRAPARAEHEPERVRGVPRRSRRPVDRADHAVGSPGPAGVPGPGDRYPAHALGTDGQRGRPGVRRLRALLRRPARGRCHRLLHRGLQGRPHVDARGRPRRAAAQADRDGEGGPHRGGPVDGRVAYRTPHRIGCGHRARCSASSA